MKLPCPGQVGRSELEIANRRSKDKLGRDLKDPLIARIQAVVSADITEDLPERIGVCQAVLGRRGIQMVRKIESLPTKLKAPTLAHGERSRQGQVDLYRARSL